MKHSQKRTFMDIEKMTSDEFKAFCRSGNKNYFTRIRKMPLQDLLFTMINRKGLTLALELRNYMKLAHPGVSISKPGYLKQRMKLNPDAFLELYKYHNHNFYADSTFSTYKDHLTLAADGSDTNIPTTAETLQLYGSASWKSTKPQVQIGLGCIYDVMNRMIMKSDCNKVKFDEIRLVEKQINTYDFCFLIKLMTLNIVEDILQEDVLFSSPSGAAMFVVGKSANGLTS